MYVVNWICRFIAGAMFAAFVMAAVGMSAANAQQPQNPTVSAFFANPGQLLQQNPNGGPLLSNAVEQLALVDPSTFKVLLGLLANANDLQKGAIGQGLAQAAKIEVLTDQATAADWQQQIAAVTDTAFKTAATNAFGDVKLGAVGAGAGVGGSTGGITNGSTSGGSLENIQSKPVTTQSFTFSSSTGAANSPSRSNSP
jgi:hypothetical protein